MRIHFIHTSYRHGFTLVETLVAISILLLVIVGPITIAQKGIQNAQFAREQLTAVFLAQEAIESIRELRDSQALDVYHTRTEVDPTSGIDTEEWKSHIPSSCASNSGCTFDRTNGFTSYSATNAKIMMNSNGIYGVGSGFTVSTPFTRVVKVSNESATGAVSVTVEITWSSKIFGGATRSVKLSTWIYDHYQRFETF